MSGADLTRMIYRGAEVLGQHTEQVNALNVFPVPDGDTGTNMSLSMVSGVKELQKKSYISIDTVSEAFSKGLLMGARGNSGVILSQLFRGFARSVKGKEELSSVHLATAFQHGVDMAYKAVVKPVEGTILTVAKEAAKHALAIARRTPDVTELMREVYDRANIALQNTPNQLPVLKQVGVVDSGGQGLLFIYQGFVQGLLEEGAAFTKPAFQTPAEESHAGFAHSAQAQLSTDKIEFFYDMEFFIKRNLGGQLVPFNEARFKQQLGMDGDSILVIDDDEVIKVHVHSRRPGDVFNYALPYGELTDVHILNMREQHRELLQEDAEHSASYAGQSGTALKQAGQVLAGFPSGQVATEQAHELAPYAIIAVSVGDGIGEIFRNNGVDVVLSGGQTMNPSTEDFVTAIQTLHAENIIILPNNGNIILAAQQAVDLLEERQIAVIPTKTIPQGLAAMIAFREDETLAGNVELMTEAASLVRSGQVTYAVRDSQIEEVEIHEGDYIGIMEKKIVVSAPDLQVVSQRLLTDMIGEDGEVVTLLTGEQANAEDIEALTNWLSHEYPEAEIDVHTGGQPLYPFIISVE
jgi:DAK2 domain fusion protein YloV